MENLPTEMLLYIFEMLSYKDQNMAMLVCRSWREIGEAQRLYSLLPIIVNTRNMSVMSGILRMEAKLSKKVSQTIVRHPGLREFELSKRNDEQTLTSFKCHLYLRI